MSNRQERPSNTQQRWRIAALGARLLAEDGISELALAKRKAARRLGLPESTLMPDDNEVEAELRSYQRLFQNEEQECSSVADGGPADGHHATVQSLPDGCGP